MGCGNNDVFHDLVLAKGGAAVFVAATFLDLVMFAGGFVDSGGAAFEEDGHHTRWRFDADLLANLGGCG